MRHLGPAELVDAAEGTTPPAVEAHLASCERCRTALERFGDTHALLETAHASDRDDSDPSPLFWDHFPDRVRAAVDDAVRAAPDRWWQRRPTAAWTAAATMLALAVGVGLGVMVSVPRPGTPAEVATAAGPADRAATADPAEPALADRELPASADAHWQLVVDLAGATGWVDEERFLASDPSPAVEEVVDKLSTGQRLELKRLLEEEIGRLSASTG